MADPAVVIEAARNAWAMERDATATDSTLSVLAVDLDTLIPAWIARLLEQLALPQRNRQDYADAIAAGRDLPPLSLDSDIAVIALEGALQATRERIDPHLDPIIERLGTLDADGDWALMATLEQAGPAVTAAVPRLLRALRTGGINRWPSHLARALANASRFDAHVVPALCDMLSHRSETLRVSALEVLATIGPGARAAEADSRCAAEVSASAAP